MSPHVIGGAFAFSDIELEFEQLSGVDDEPVILGETIEGRLG